MAKSKKLPSIKILNEYFYYDGRNLRNRKSRGGVKAGTIAGTPFPRERITYMRVHFHGANYYAHRIIWKMITGFDPKGVIDHEDGNGLNNTAYNLRDTTERDNHKNMRLSKANKSGVQGVRFREDTRKWFACVDIGKGKSTSKSFTKKSEAIEWRASKLKELGYHPLHGTDKGDQNGTTSTTSYISNHSTNATY